MKGGDQKQFQCTHPGCDKVFNRRDYLERHATNHLPVKPYVCIQCDRHFSRKDLFDNHLSTKRHARVAHEVEHNVVAATAAHTSKPDTSSYLSDEFDESGVIGSNEVPLRQHPDGFAVPTSLPDLRRLSGLTSPGSALRLQPDQSQGYFDYGLGPPHNDAAAWGLDGQEEQRQRDFFFRQQQQQQEDQQHQQQQLHHQKQYQAQQRLQQEHKQQQEGERRHFQHQHQHQHEHPQREQESLRQRQAQEWDQQQLKARSRLFTSSVTGDARGASGLRTPHGVDSPELLSGLMSWPPALAVSQRRASAEAASSGGTGSKHTQAIAASEFASLRSPVSDSEEATSSAILEQLIADDVANTDVRAFALLRESQANSRRDSPSMGSRQDLRSDTQADAITRVEGDSRYAWFFDDSFDTDKSKYGYDLCYSEAMDAYATRAAESRGTPGAGDLKHGSVGASSSSPGSLTSASSTTDVGSSLVVPISPTGAGPSPTKLTAPSPALELPGIASITLHPAKATLLIRTLRDLPPYLQDEFSINSALRAAWIHAEDISHIVHRPTFDANNAHPALLSVMVLIGLALSDQREAAHRLYPSAYLHAYQSLHSIPIGRVTKVDQTVVETLQSLCLLLRYEPHILGSEIERLSFTKGEAGRYVTDRFLWTALSSVAHSNEFSSPFSDSHVQHQPIWSTTCSEAFLFHQGAEPEAQWREWALLEAAQRTLHLAVYCDGVRAFIGSGEAPVSLFNLDIHMVSSDALWDARTADQFFFIAGPSGALTTVPYLGLIKALIRFPRVAQRPGEQDFEHDKLKGTPWSMFALQVLAHGLISIVGRLSGLYAHEDEMLEAVVNVRGVLTFDNRIQARLYRGLNVWVQNFNAAHGPVGEQPFRASGSGPVPQHAMLIMLCHYASFIYIHEDVPIVRQVTANLKTWLETRGSGKSQEMLDYLYMPLYVKWIKTDEAKSIVSTSALYLAWMHAVSSQVPGRADYLFLSAMIYISTVAVWLYEFASHEGVGVDNTSPEQGTLRLDNYQFMDDAIEYLDALHANVSKDGPPPKTRSAHSVILLSACMLHRREATSQLVNMLIEILTVMSLGNTKEELMEVVKSSTQVYHDRLIRTLEFRDCPSTGSTTVKSGSVTTELESEVESYEHMSDVEMSNQFLSPSVGHAMIA